MSPRHVLRRLLDVIARLVGADADPPLSRGGHGPGVAVADYGAIDPDVEVPAAWIVRVDLQAARDPRLGRLTAPPGPRAPPPAERVDDQRGRHVAAVSPHHLSRPIADGRDLEARVGLLPQRGAQLAIVEARPAPRQPEARRAVRGVEAHALQLLPDRALDAHL